MADTNGPRQGNDTVQQIKDRLSIVDVVAPYVKLTRAGKYHRGLSPFTKEKTASFYVSPDRGSYYCFSTSQGGDHFTFIEKMEGVDFKGAMKILADKAGVEIQQLRPQDKEAGDRKEKLRNAMSAAEQFFAAGLAEGPPAYLYATERGLTPETIKAWNLGFAPAGWRGLLEHLGAAPSAGGAPGYTPKELALAGLVKEADEKPGTWYDRFRNRLMFPIRDLAGRTVAFTGRTLEKEEGAKYLNSPETDLFKKGDILFGMDRAKDSIRGRGFAILVEGQFDLLLLHQAGFTNTIALSGTALSATHLGLIKRYADNLMLALDADRAGLSAAAKSAHAALSMGMRVKAVRLPAGKDPADVVSEAGGEKVFSELVQGSQSIIEFFLSVISASETDDFKLLRRVEETVLPLVAAVKSPLERNKYIEIIARSVSQSPEAVREAMQKVPASPNTVADTGARPEIAYNRPGEQGGNYAGDRGGNRGGYGNGNGYRSGGGYGGRDQKKYGNSSGYGNGNRSGYGGGNSGSYGGGTQRGYGNGNRSYGSGNGGSSYGGDSYAYGSYEDEQAGQNAAPAPSAEVSAMERRRQLILAVVKAYPDSSLAERVSARYTEILSAPAFPLEALADLDERLLFEAEQAFGEAPSDEAGDELLKEFELMYLRDARARAGQDVRRAEAADDASTLSATMQRIKEIDMRIRALS